MGVWHLNIHSSLPPAPRTNSSSIRKPQRSICGSEDLLGIALVGAILGSPSPHQTTKRFFFHYHPQNFGSDLKDSPLSLPSVFQQTLLRRSPQNFSLRSLFSNSTLFARLCRPPVGGGRAESGPWALKIFSSVFPRSCVL